MCQLPLTAREYSGPADDSVACFLDCPTGARTFCNKGTVLVVKRRCRLPLAASFAKGCVGSLRLFGRGVASKNENNELSVGVNEFRVRALSMASGRFGEKAIWS